jgi:DNA repair protein RadC
MSLDKHCVTDTGLKAFKTPLQARLGYRVPKLRLCLVQEPEIPYEEYVIRTSKDAQHLFEPLRHESEEHFLSLHLNSKHEVIGLHEVSHGTLSSSLVHPREVFKAAMLANSHAILICHNHPSGSNISASKEDLETTEQLLRAGCLLNIPVLDHLIVSPIHDTFSMREHHPELWP